MFEDPELPDFDSMSQEELIEWLEELTKMQGGAGDFADDVPDAAGRNAADDPDSEADEEWAPLLDDSPPAKASPASAADGDVSDGDEFAASDEETLIDLARFETRDSGPLDAAAMAWLAEISAAESEEELPDISDYQQPAPPPDNFDELLAQGALEDPLEWLDDLGNRPAGPRLPVAAANEPQDQDKAAPPDSEYGDDFDDAYEDDEQLDDLEDESLYSRRSGETQKVLQSIMGMQDRESEEYSTQSMAPVPENVERATADEARSISAKTVVERPKVTAGADDSLTQAFMLQEGRVDLETWYRDRLRAVSATAEGAAQTAAIPALDHIAALSKPPPPGLAAAIYSARGKVEANDLREALTDYETLLRTNAGLEWVISDMRGLIAREAFRRHPSVHRVLGDALMRQGNLDAALDVYRHALTLL